MVGIERGKARAGKIGDVSQGDGKALFLGGLQQIELLELGLEPGLEGGIGRLVEGGIDRGSDQGSRKQAQDKPEEEGLEWHVRLL